MKKLFIAIVFWAGLTAQILSGSFVDATTIGFSTDPSVDNTPAWNALVLPGGPGSVYFEGSFTFKTQPNENNRVIRLTGFGVNGTALIRDFVPASGSSAFIKSNATITIENMAIIARQGTNGYGIMLNTIGASASVIRDDYVTAESGASWGIPLVLYSNDTLGIRSVIIDNVELFAGTVHGAWIVNAQGLTANFQVYPAGGTVDHVVIQNNGVNRAAAIDLRTRHLITLWVYGTDNLLLQSTTGTTMYVSSDSTNVREL